MFDVISPDAFGSARLPTRFWAKVTVARNGCWLWQGALNEDGYGRLFVDRAMCYAHRIAYLALVGPIGADRVIDHVCRTRHCVNPEHMQPVTRQDNALRGVGHTAKNARKTHCIHGHEFTEANTDYGRDGAQRRCRACITRRAREYWHRRAARLANVR